MRTLEPRLKIILKVLKGLNRDFLENAWFVKKILKWPDWR